MTAETPTPLLSGTDLSVIRGDRLLFSELEFALSAGEMLLIEGANGTGKTTLLRAIAGLLELDTGRVSWNGSTIEADRQAFCSQLVWMAHRIGFKSDLTLIENLRFECSLRDCDFTRLDRVLERLQLRNFSSLPFRALSAGQQRRVVLARLLLATGDVWLMDEPFTNLDAAGQSLVLDIITEHLAKGGLCIVASHQPVEVEGDVKRIRLQ